MRRILVGFGLWLGAASGAMAGQVERACLASPRAGGDRVLCSCIQQVADMTLSPAEQRRVARFFRDPESSQEAKARDDIRSEAFWNRYAEFGAAAEGLCAPGDG